MGAKLYRPVGMSISKKYMPRRHCQLSYSRSPLNPYSLTRWPYRRNRSETGLFVTGVSCTGGAIGQREEMEPEGNEDTRRIPTSLRLYSCNVTKITYTQCYNTQLSAGEPPTLSPLVTLDLGQREEPVAFPHRIC